VTAISYIIAGKTRDASYSVKITHSSHRKLASATLQMHVLSIFSSY